MAHGLRQRKCLLRQGEPFSESFSEMRGTSLYFYSHLIRTCSILIHRFISSGVYLFFLGLTLFLAFYPHKILFRGLLLVTSITVQFLALCKYCVLSAVYMSVCLLCGVCFVLSAMHYVPYVVVCAVRCLLLLSSYTQLHQHLTTSTYHHNCNA